MQNNTMYYLWTHVVKIFLKHDIHEVWDGTIFLNQEANE